MNETRVNLKHLLEDIRDSYASPLEEIILTELVANALDGKAVKVAFEVDAGRKFLRCVDDGVGMKRVALRDYHNIAASAKTRGLGIGFAGVGAKLSLLIAEKVVTESKGGNGTKSATEWQMTGPYRAPWKFLPFAGSVATPRGTAVTMYFSDNQSHLLNAEFVERTIIKHFYPLLTQKFYEQILKYFYRKQIQFFVNGRQVVVPEEKQDALRHWFFVRVGQGRHAAGAGFLVKTGQEPTWLQKIIGQPAPFSSLPSGLWISTFGKVIKGGWEWLGILPKHAEGLTGLVEIPALSEILTTNKNDFLSDAASLKKYYKYRKAVQEAVLPILRELGEDPAVPREAPEKLLKPLNQTVAGALNQLVGEFPELEGLIGGRRTQALGRVKREKDEKDDGEFATPRDENDKQGEDVGSALREHDDESGAKPAADIPSGVADESRSKTIKAKTAGLELVLGEISDSDGLLLGRIVENTLTINTAHPAWQKAKQKGMEEYHVIITVSAVLSQFLESEKNPQEFLNRLLVAWAKEIVLDKPGRLL
jgi:hypothetical protein